MTPSHPLPPDAPNAPLNTHQPGRFEADDILASVRHKARRQRPQKALPACPIAPRELPPGTRFRGYTLRRVLGAGGFAVTYLAEEDATRQRVVIKEHFPEYLCHREAGTGRVQVADKGMASACKKARASFLREHKLLSSLNHPHILRASACFEAHDTTYYTTEYIEGISLNALMADYKAHDYQLPQQEVYATLVRLLDALGYLHDKGLLHRDIKPANILITREGMPVLIDFGAAHELRRGEPAYLVEVPGFSPAEQCHKEGKLGPWTDIYALGATFRYLLTGSTLPPCRQRELVDRAKPLTRKKHLRAHYHPRLLASIDRATRPHAHERYQRVDDWLADLQA